MIFRGRIKYMMNIDDIYNGCYNKPPGSSYTRCIAHGFCIKNKKNGISYGDNMYLLSTTKQCNTGMTYQEVMNYYANEYSSFNNYINSVEIKLSLALTEEYEHKFCK